MWTLLSTFERKDLMPIVKAHLMQGAHLQVALKTKCLWLLTTFYNYGNGVSQDISIRDGVS
jgi:hypothetical protein